jgi:hypothetical protein
MNIGMHTGYLFTKILGITVVGQKTLERGFHASNQQSSNQAIRGKINHLSIAGKKVLVNFVINVLPLHFM